MHVKVDLGGTYLNETSYYSGATYVHTGQLFFNDSLTDLVNQQSPYKNKTGSRMQNSQDQIYASTGGVTLMNVQYLNSGSDVTSGMITAVALYVRSSTPTSNTTAAGTVAPSNSGGGRVGGRPFWLWWTFFQATFFFYWSGLLPLVIIFLRICLQDWCFLSFFVCFEQETMCYKEGINTQEDEVNEEEKHVWINLRTMISEIIFLNIWHFEGNRIDQLERWIEGIQDNFGLTMFRTD